jgi:hypothetical protein
MAMHADLLLYALVGVVCLIIGFSVRPALHASGVRLARLLSRTSPAFRELLQREALFEDLRREAVTPALIERELNATSELLARAPSHERTLTWGHLRALESHRALLSHALRQLRTDSRGASR